MCLCHLNGIGHLWESSGFQEGHGRPNQSLGGREATRLSLGEFSKLLEVGEVLMVFKNLHRKERFKEILPSFFEAKDDG